MARTKSFSQGYMQIWKNDAKRGMILGINVYKRFTVNWHSKSKALLRKSAVQMLLPMKTHNTNCYLSPPVCYL